MHLTEVYTVEYSVLQHYYHIDTLDKTLKNNLSAVDRELNNGYLIIGIFKNYEAAYDFMLYHRQHRRLSQYRVNPSGEIGY
jgi:hypothetical protein